MDWIFAHFQVVVAIVLVVVWILRSMGAANKPPGAGRPTRPGANEDPAEAARTRQIQEEIRRRILARQRAETMPPAMPASPQPPPMPPTVVVIDEDATYSGEGPHGPMPTAAAHRAEDAAQAAILEQQRTLMEQLHALRAARAAGEVMPTAAAMRPERTDAAMATHLRSCRRELRRDLRSPSSVRRAILLKEILGEPLALQRNRQLPRR